MFSAQGYSHSADACGNSRFRPLGVIYHPLSSDQEDVLGFESQSTPELRLIGRSDGAPERMVYYLTGAILACGGQMLSRRFHSDGSAAIECEFLRVHCVDIYGVLLAAGLQLSRSSHLKMAELCRCTHAMPGGFEDQRVILELEVMDEDSELPFVSRRRLA